MERVFVTLKSWIAEKADLEMQKYGMGLQILNRIENEVTLEALMGIEKETEKAICIKATTETGKGNLSSWTLWIPKSQLIKIENEKGETI